MHSRLIKVTCAFLATMFLTIALEAREQHQATPTERTAAQVRGSTISGGAVLMDSATGASAEQRQAQYETLRQIEELRVIYDARGVPRNLYGRTSLVVPKEIDSAQGRAALEDVLVQVRKILLAEGSETLSVASEPTVLQHVRSIPFHQSIRGIPVRDGKVVLTVDDRTETVVMMSASFLPDRGLPQEPKVTATAAISNAFAWLQRANEVVAKRPSVRNHETRFPAPETLPYALEGVTVRGEPELAYRNGQTQPTAEPGRLVWVVELEKDSSQFNTVEVDAIDGSVIGASPPDSLNRHVYDSNGTANLGTLVRSEGNPPVAQPYVNAVYDNLGFALSALNVIGPTGVDGNRFRLAVRSLTTQGLQSATSESVWDPPANDWMFTLKFGPGIPGSPGVNNHLGNALDAVAHELSHSVATKKTSLICTTDPCTFAARAINEGLADVAGIASDMSFSKPQPWLLAEEVTGNSLGLRNAAAPKSASLAARDWFPDASHATLLEGGQHLNATILTHAYYLLVNGGYHYRAGQPASPGQPNIPQILVPPLGRQVSERIFYGSLLAGTYDSNTTFFGARDTTRDLAQVLFTPVAANAVTQAWAAVGVGTCTSPPPVPTIQAEHICPWWRLSTLSRSRRNDVSLAVFDLPQLLAGRYLA